MNEYYNGILLTNKNLYVYIEIPVFMSVASQKGWNWENWTNSERMLIVTFLATIISLFLAWRDIGFATKAGISTGEGWVALILVSYPGISILRGRTVKKIPAIILMTLAILWGIINLISGYELLEADGFFIMEDTWLDFNGIGAYLFIPVSILGLVGAIKYSIPTPLVIKPLAPPPIGIPPNPSLVGSFDENGYEWIKHNGQDYWRTDGQGSKWILHE